MCILNVMLGSVSGMVMFFLNVMLGSVSGKGNVYPDCDAGFCFRNGICLS